MPDLSGAWIAFAALIIAAATLWNGSRRTTVDMLEKQVDGLKEEVQELRQKLERARDEINTLRTQNYDLMEKMLGRKQT